MGSFQEELNVSLFNFPKNVLINLLVLGVASESTESIYFLKEVPCLFSSL